jgi:hypothetical protein
VSASVVALLHLRSAEQRLSGVLALSKLGYLGQGGHWVEAAIGGANSVIDLASVFIGALVVLNVAIHLFQGLKTQAEQAEAVARMFRGSR